MISSLGLGKKAAHRPAAGQGGVLGRGNRVQKQCDWPVPVWTHKPESDMAHEKISRLILENHDIVYFACASHNVRSIAAVMEYARQLDVPEERYEFQVLYGMAEPVRRACATWLAVCASIAPTEG